MVIVIVLVLLLLWGLGFANHFGGDLIHLLIVLAVLGFIFEGAGPYWRGRRRGE